MFSLGVICQESSAKRGSGVSVDEALLGAEGNG